MESKIPVVLDCYADWCAPCKKLEPILVSKMAEHEGKIKLVKLNIDNFPQLTTGLNIRSVPSLFLIFKGNIVDMLQGFQPAQLDEFIQTALVIGGMETDENMMQDILVKL
jgi:thioredoxin